MGSEEKAICRKSLIRNGLWKVERICGGELVDPASFVGIFGAQWEEMEFFVVLRIDFDYR